MKTLKFLRISVVVTLFMSLAMNGANATLFQGFPIASDTQAVTVEDRLSQSFSFIVNMDVTNAVESGIGVEKPEATKFCDEFNTHGCDISPTADLDVKSILPVCGNEVENCIESLEIKRPDGQNQAAKFNRYFKGKTFASKPELDFPGGSRVSLWNVDSEQYVVNTQLNWGYKSGQVVIKKFESSVFAVKLVTDARFKDSGIYFGPAFNGIYGSVTETGEYSYDGSCVAVEAGLCGERIDLPTGTRITLKLKLSNKVTGWLHGRISKPEINVTPIDAKFNSLTVAADVVQVPMMYAQYKVSEQGANFTDSMSKNSNGRGFYGVTAYRQVYPENDNAMLAVTTLADSVKNTATEVHTFWNLSSLPNNSMNKCMSDTSKLIGFVTTNAMTYSGRTPNWDGENLTYKVAGLHYLTDGKTLALGTYDLAMRSETARCLYGFTNAPISATISITSQDGEQKVATTVLNEKNGWLYLAAYGFTFSAPSIKIKLIQEKAIEAAQPSPSPTGSTPKQIKSIKCFKGKTVKTVKGFNPQCPKGYKSK